MEGGAVAGTTSAREDRSIHQSMLEEAVRIIDRARDGNVTLRLMGGRQLQLYRECRHLNPDAHYFVHPGGPCGRVHEHLQNGP